MQFVVGGKYKRRDGVEVTLEEDDKCEMPFYFSDGLWRWPDGKLFSTGVFDSRDITSVVELSGSVSSSLVDAARRVVELHDQGCLSSAVGDSIAIEALRKASLTGLAFFVVYV